MELIPDPSRLPRPVPASAVAGGAFDGVHMGHLRVLERLLVVARELSVPAVVLLVDPPGDDRAPSDSSPPILTDLPQRLSLLDAAGVDIACLLRLEGAGGARPQAGHLGAEVRAEGPSAEPSIADRVVAEVLVDRLGARAVVVGPGGGGGRGRDRDAGLVRRAAEARGLRVEVVPPALAGGVPICSAAVREAVEAGDMRRAAMLLGRSYEVHGTVVRGDGRGRELGFPTANVAVPGGLALPADGVYAGWHRRPNGDRHPAAISVGRRPTFYADAGLLLVESHLLDFAGELYGETARVTVDSRLRGQIRFDSPGELVAAIAADVAAARRLLGGMPAPSGRPAAAAAEHNPLASPDP